MRADIDATRDDLIDKLSELGDRASDLRDRLRHAFDLEYQVEQRPWAVVGAAVGLGIALGFLLGD